ncbi:MAG: transaldolase [Phycisphaeraceae bacterium]
MNLLEQLRKMTVVVADTGDIDAIAQHKPQDATTNPSLIFKAAQMPQYQKLIDSALAWAENQKGTADEKLDKCLDKLCVNFGLEILKIVPGRVSTEVPAALSFDTDGTVERARQLIALYAEAGIDKKRILIKMASTWEGIKAGEKLEQEGIRCNLTLLFSFAQAVACAEAGVQLISPFVGRIYDWYKKSEGVADIPADKDPGVASVTSIYNYYKKYGYKTEVMGASFRKTEQIIGLAGSDLLTIAPDLLVKLASTEGTLERKLDAAAAKGMTIDKVNMTEKNFRWHHNEDAMATDKLAEGIRAFHADMQKLRAYVAKRMGVAVAV